MLQDLQDEKTTAASKEPFCKQKQHRKVLDKGVPEDVMPGIKNSKVWAWNWCFSYEHGTQKFVIVKILVSIKCVCHINLVV